MALNDHRSKMNAPKVMKACEKALLWDEAVFLLKEDEQYDSAVKTMIAHPSAFRHDLFLDCAQKVRNAEVYYKAIQFYVEQQPLQLNRLLQVLTPNLDHSRVTHQLRKLENLPLALPYLRDVQKENLTAVNDAVNELCVDDEDYDALRSSINDFDNFDHIALAQKVEKHELLEFRRIAATIYKKHKRWEQSIRLSKADKMYKDAIDTCSASGDPALAEDLLRFFVDVCDKEYFCATLYTCYKIVTPDVALELAWRSTYVDFAMPYVIQYARHLHDTIAELEKRTAPKEKPSESERAPAASAATYGDPAMGMAGAPLQLGYQDPSMGYADPSQMGYADPSQTYNRGMPPQMLPQPGIYGQQIPT